MVTFRAGSVTVAAIGLGLVFGLAPAIAAQTSVQSSPQPRQELPTATTLAPYSAGGPAPAREPAELRRLIDDGQYGPAEESALALAAAIEKRDGAQAPAIADALLLALEARRFGRRMATPGTVDLAQRALTLIESAIGGAGVDHPRVADALLFVGLAQSGARKPTEAQAAVTRAIEIRERAFGPDDISVAAALNVMGSVRWAARMDVPAMEAVERALAIARKREQPPGNETAAALALQASAVRVAGDWDRTARLYEEVLAIDERTRGVDHPQLAGTILSLAGTLRDLGDLDRARALHERAIRILEHTPGAERRLAFELISISTVFDAIGDYPAGLAVCERAVTFSEQVAGPQSTLTAAALDQLALMQTRLGDHAAAAAVRERTIALWTAAQGPESVHVGTALNALAESREEAGEIDTAFEVVERALKIEALAQQPAVFARVLQTHARLLAKMNRLDEARAVLERARKVSTAVGFSTARTDLATTLAQLARVERQAGQPTRALPLYREAIALTEQEIGATHPVSLTHRGEFATALAEAGVYDEARSVLRSTELASLEHLRLLARATTDRRALEFAADRESGVNLALTLATSPKVRTAADRDTAWQLTIQGRTVVLDEMAARQRTVAAESNNEEIRARLTTLNRARSRLAHIILRGPEGQPAERYQAQVERARGERDRAEQALADASAAFRDEQRRAQAGVDDVMSRLPKDAALVAYVRYTPQRLTAQTPQTQAAASSGSQAAYAVFVARPGAPVRLVSLGPAVAIDAAIEKWRERIQVELQSGGLAAARNEAAYRQAGAALRALVWDPIATLIGSAASTFIVPDGALHLVDFSTLPTGRASYLVEGASTLHYLLAERDLLQPAGEPRGGSLLALGAPDFEKVNRSALATLQQERSPSGEERGLIENVGLVASRHLSRSACDAFDTQTFAPLPATTEEVRHIAALWRQGAEAEGRTLLLGGDSASESVFKSLAPGHRVLHLATHGFFLDRNCMSSSPNTLAAAASPATSVAANRSAASAISTRLLEESPLLRSGLVLAGANRRTEASSEDDDGMLTAEEIAGLDLSSAQWTVLSACDTGRGDWQAGEGVLGLRRAFQVAGARTVILSLWPVIDTVAADWMTALYKRKFVENASTAEAVRGANRTMLAARRAAKQSTHPLYWSGFIATGDWR